MRIQVTDLDTGVVSEYQLSRNNWRNAWACMLNGAVVMWWPSEAGEPRIGAGVITSGRRWLPLA